MALGMDFDHALSLLPHPIPCCHLLPLDEYVKLSAIAPAPCLPTAMFPTSVITITDNHKLSFKTASKPPI